MSVCELLGRIDLASVLTELSGEPTGTGPRARWRCCAADHPDDHPSVSMFRDRAGIERWRCWSGDHAGTAVDAVMAAHRVDLATAIRTLEERSGITSALTPRPGIPPAIRTPAPDRLSPAARLYLDACAHNLWTATGAPARAWLHQRGLTDDTLTANMVGFDPGPRALPRPDGLPQRGGVTYVSFDAAGEPCYVQTRHLTGPRKYSNPSSGHGPLPHLIHHRPAHGVAFADGAVIVTEGVADGLIATQVGVDTVSVISAANITPTISTEIADYAAGRKIVIAFDADPAGRRAADVVADQLAALGHRAARLQLPDGHDLTSTYQPTHLAAPAARTMHTGAAR